MELAPPLAFRARSAAIAGTDDAPRTDISALESFFKDELRKYISTSISEDVDILNRQIAESDGDPLLRNRLGVLYARYGLFSEAETQFIDVIRKKEHFPTLINLGNIKFLSQKFEEAREYYQRAAVLVPEHPSVLLALARVNHELENYGNSRSAYENLKQVNPALARKYSYLELSVNSGSRAASGMSVYSDLIWEE